MQRLARKDFANTSLMAIRNALPFPLAARDRDGGRHVAHGDGRLQRPQQGRMYYIRLDHLGERTAGGYVDLYRTISTMDMDVHALACVFPIH